MPTPNADRLKAVHPEYQSTADDWAKCRDFIAGEKALRIHDINVWKGHLASIVAKTEGGSGWIRRSSGSNFSEKVMSCYIAPLSDRMTFNEYILFMFRGHYYNVVNLTKSGYLGKIFGKEPRIDLPAGADIFIDDADLAETPLKEFLENITDEILSVGRCAVLVDRPPSRGAVTTGDAERSGLRPYLATYIAEDILDWKILRMGSRSVATYFKLRESAIRDGGKPDYTYRELILDELGYHQFEWTRMSTDDDYSGEKIVPGIGAGMAPLKSIPFFPFSPRGGGWAIEPPPLMALIDQALEHYQSNVEYGNARFRTAIPTPGFYGFSEDEMESITLGGAGAVYSSNSSAHAEYLEYQGSGLEPLRNAIQDVEARQAKLGDKMLTQDKAAAEAADTVRLRAAGETATLADIACSISRISSQMMALAAEWNNTPGPVEIELNAEFTELAPDPQEITALGGLVDKGQFTQSDLNARLRQVNILAADRSDEDIEAELEGAKQRAADAQGQGLLKAAAAIKAAGGAPVAPDKANA